VLRGNTLQRLVQVRVSHAQSGHAGILSKYILCDEPLEQLLIEHFVIGQWRTLGAECVDRQLACPVEFDTRNDVIVEYSHDAVQRVGTRSWLWILRRLPCGRE